MIDRNAIYAQRRALLISYMKEKGLGCLMFFNPGAGNWDLWLPDAATPRRDTGPVMLPFDRSDLFLVAGDGTVTRRSALDPHPTDPYLFPLLDLEADREILGDGPIGLVNMDALKKDLRDALLAECPGRELTDATADLDRLKAVKSAEELELAKTAAQMFDRAFTSFPMVLQSGISEHRASVDIRQRFSDLGVSTEDLNALTALELTSAPDGGPAVTEIPTHPGRILAGGDRINVLVNGYGMPDFACAMGRSYTFGAASGEAKEYWDLAVAAQDAAAAAAVPGATIREIRAMIDAQYIEPNGLLPDDTNFMYGLGAYRCEAPRSVDETADMPLEAGVVLAIGPAIRPEGKDPYCCMDPFVVTDHGAERISETPRVLRELYTAL